MSLTKPKLERKETHIKPCQKEVTQKSPDTLEARVKELERRMAILQDVVEDIINQNITDTESGNTSEEEEDL